MITTAEIEGVIERNRDSRSEVWRTLRGVLKKEDLVIQEEDGVYITHINKYEEVEEVECFRFSESGDEIYAAEETEEEDIVNWIEVVYVREAVNILEAYVVESERKNKALEEAMLKRCD